MRMRSCSGRLAGETVLALADTMAAAPRGTGAEPLEVVRTAFHTSSTALTSGSGRGIYREYLRVADEEWKLTVDAEISTHFDGEKFHVDLKYHPEFKGLACRRITFDGKALETAWFSPGWLTRGQTKAIRPDDYGDGLCRPQLADFPWDVRRLSSNVCDVERLIKNVTADKIEITQTPEGDLLGSFAVVNDNGLRVRFECPKKFGFNLARLRVLSDDEPRPLQEARVEWKLSTAGLWYVRSVQEDFGSRRANRRFRRIMKYVEFEPNAKVDPEVFTLEWLRRPLERQANDPVREPKQPIGANHSRSPAF
jgi:hypothetical protein